MRTLLAIAMLAFTFVTFTDVHAEPSATLKAAQAVTEQPNDMIWFDDEFWADPALTDQPILKTSTATVPERDVNDFYANMLFSDNIEFDIGRPITDAEIEYINTNMLWEDNAEYQALNQKR